MTPIRTMIVDDDALILAGLTTIIDSHPDLVVVARSEDGRELVELVHSHRPDVVLVDIRMPYRDGLEAIADLRAAQVDVKVVVLTTFAEHDYFARAVELDVDGYLLKSSSPAELAAAVRAVAAGGAVLSPPVARWLLDAGGSHAARRGLAMRRIAALTGRQRDVLALITEGASNAEIGERLYLSEATVKGYVSEILTRLDVRRRVQAAILAHEAQMPNQQDV